MFSPLFLSILIALSLLIDTRVIAWTKSKPHTHNGTLNAFDGRPLPVHITAAQEQKLSTGEAVIFKERDGRSGRGVVVQDVQAPPGLCMDKIRDLAHYPKMVPNVKKVDVYESHSFENGTTQTGAEFKVGVLGFSLGYFLKLTHEPTFNTLTWSLDYKYNSDIDDNVGHWQVMDHPSKSNHTRILYSTKIKMFPWIPEFVVNLLTDKALVEATAWVKRESEVEAQKQGFFNGTAPMKSNWFNFRGGSIGQKKTHLFRRLSGITTPFRMFHKSSF